MTIYLSERFRLTGDITLSGEAGSGFYRLTLPTGPAGQYRIAQVDDYSALPRGRFLHQPPVSFSVRARVSSNTLPGTWGFGFWNDPFALGIGIKGSGVRLPALPEAAWFFYGSPQNDLSFSSKTSANGLMASVFSSARVPSVLLPLGLPALPLLGIRTAARRIRRLASRFIHEDFSRQNVDTVRWHTYRLDWLTDSVEFRVDDVIVQSSSLSPRPPLGLVIWIDNQYAAFSAEGTIAYGTQENPVPAWMEIRNLAIESHRGD